MRTFPLLLVLSLTLSLAGQAQTKTDAEATYGLTGPVRSFRTETASVVVKEGQNVEGPRVLRMTAEFDEAGNRTDLGMYEDNGVLVRRIVTKFDGPRMIEFVNYDGAGQVWLQGTQAYDKQDRLIEEATYNGDKSDGPQGHEDDGSGLSFEEDKPRIDQFAEGMKKNKSAKAYIIAYGGLVSYKNEAAIRLRCIRNYLVNAHDISPSRLKLIDVAISLK
jgi:hypothetical protein